MACIRGSSCAVVQQAKIAVALQDETVKMPTKEKIEEVFLLTCMGDVL
jgi:hypothetical protein